MFYPRLTKTLIVVGAGLLALTACGSNSTQSSASGSGSGAAPIKLASVLANTSDPFFASIGCGAQAEADKLGVELKQYNSTSTDSNQIASNFQSATLSSPQGVLVTPFNNNQFVAQYQQLMAQGVPVVSGNGSQPQAEYKFISSDTDTARFVPDVLKTVPAGAGSMVYLGGAPGIPPLESRTLPFVDAIAAARPDLTQLPNDYSQFDINKVTTSVSSLILAHPDLKLIVAASGPDGQGAAAAIKQAGKVGQITLVAFDAVPPEVQALRDGTITALIAQAPQAIGQAQVDALVDYIKAHPDGGPVSPAGTQPIPNQLLTKDTIDDPANANYIYKTTC